MSRENPPIPQKNIGENNRRLELIQRISTLRMACFGKRGKAAFARAIGVAAPTYDKYENGSIPNALVLAKMISATGCSPRWLLYGEGDPFPSSLNPEPRTLNPDVPVRDRLISHLQDLLDEIRSRPAAAIAGRPLPAEWADRFCAIPLLADAAGAAAAMAIDETEIDDYVMIYKRWCPRPWATTAIRVEGDSMEPILRAGSIVAVDAGVRGIGEVAGKVVAIRDPDEEGVTIRRVIVRENKVVFQPENRAYPGLEMAAEEVEERGIIVGKVIWAWGLFE